MSKHEVCSEIAGSVWKVVAARESTVNEGDVLVILESMKMEIPITAPCSGVVLDIGVAEGDTVEEDQVVVTMGVSA